MKTSDNAINAQHYVFFSFAQETTKPQNCTFLQFKLKIILVESSYIMVKPAWIAGTSHRNIAD